MHKVLRHPVLFKRALAHAMEDDALNIAQSAAYSAMVALFPALLVLAAVLPLVPDTAPLRPEIVDVMRHILPGDVTPLIEGYFSPSGEKFSSVRALLLAALVSISGASGVLATFMEGLRRAYRLPPNCWSFWSRRLRALLLVPISLLPLFAASLLVLFGHFLALRLAGYGAATRGGLIYVVVISLRWGVAVAGSIGLLALLYKLGTPMHLAWRAVVPGAVLATALWFASTLIFGWYVTRFANYSRVYGSLGAGIALLFWLYLTSLSVLCGAEFNAQLRVERVSTEEGLTPSQASWSR